MIHSTRTRVRVAACAAVALGSLGAVGLANAADSTEQVVRALQTRVQSLEDREAIHKVLNDYGRLIDERNFEAFAQLFAQSSEYDSAGTVTKGPVAIATFLKDMQIGVHRSGGRQQTRNGDAGQLQRRAHAGGWTLEVSEASRARGYSGAHGERAA